MESAKNKIKEIFINEKELNILSLVEQNCFNTEGFLPDYSNTYRGDLEDTSNILQLKFAPNKKQNQNLQNREFENELKLILNDQIVGKITQVKSFECNKKEINIFNENIYKQGDNPNPYISGKVSINNNYFMRLKTKVLSRIKKQNAKKITALVLNADPITRAHERMFRWTIDKADLVLAFIIAGCDSTSLDFNIKKECFEFFVKNFLPQERIIPIYLEHIDLFSPHLDPKYECLLASSFGANKLVIGQNHQGLGLFFDNNLAHTAIDELSKQSGLELIVLPEFVFCNKCNMMVSVKSCPHGSHHHIKYRSSMIKEMLHSGLIPPTVLVRKEISAKLLAHLHPNRFKNVQAIYDALFPSSGIIEERNDEDLYKDLLNLYRTGYMI